MHSRADRKLRAAASDSEDAPLPIKSRARASKVAAELRQELLDDVPMRTKEAHHRRKRASFGPDATFENLQDANPVGFIRARLRDDVPWKCAAVNSVCKEFIESSTIRHCNVLVSTQGSNQHVVRFKCLKCGTAIARLSISKRSLKAGG